MAFRSFDTGGADELRGLSLCAGYAGLDLGLELAEPGYRTVCYVEREAHAAAALVARMADAALASAPIWDDLRSFDGGPWRDRIHILSAGYPCQPFSHAGKRKGEADPRHLWPEVARIIGEVGPRGVFVENVEGHIDLGFAEVAASLRGLGYRAKAGLFTAREAGAPHRRRRLFVLAYADRDGCGLSPRSHDPSGCAAAGEPLGHQREQLRPVSAFERGEELDAPLADLACRGVEAGLDAGIFAPAPGELQIWEGLLDRRPDLQPAISRDGHGLADRLDRTRGVGNGVCSLEAAFAYRTLKTDFEREWGIG